MPSRAPLRIPFAPNLDFNSNTIHIEEHLRPGQPQQTKLSTYGPMVNRGGPLQAPRCCIHLQWRNDVPLNNTSPGVHLQSQGQGSL